MKKIFSSSHALASLLVCWLFLTASLFRADATDAITWSDDFPPLPDPYGYAGGFAGIVGEGDDRILVFAGGANFPYENPFDEAKNTNNGQPKVFHNTAFSISLTPEGLKANGEWKAATPLPAELAYGASVSLPHDHSALFIGGNLGADGKGKSAKVYRVSTEDGKVAYTPLADLPVGVTNISATLVDKTVYVFSGISAAGAERQFLALDTSDKDANKWKWESLTWPEREAGKPARARGNYTMGNLAGKIYVFAGRHLHDPADTSMANSDTWKVNDQLSLDFFRDCYAYTPGVKNKDGSWKKEGSWKRIADLPFGISAAPTTAIPAGYSHLLLMGGAHVDHQLKLRANAEKYGLDKNFHGFKHPGFPRTIWGYHNITNTWSKFGEIPEDKRSPVTAPLVVDETNFVVVSGEWSPKLRTSEVLGGKVYHDRPAFGVINWIVVIVYLLGMVGIGYWFMKREAANSTDDYFRGGQRIPWWVAGLSIFATMLSSITFMSIPALAYADNWNKWIGQWTIFILVPLVVFFYLPFYRKLNLTSAYEYLEARFNLALRLIASISFMVFHIGRIAMVLYLPALALSSVTNIDINVAIIVIGVLCVIYTVMGGIEAVVWTDAIQALVLIGGALLCFILVITNVDGGFGAITDVMANSDKFLTLDWSMGEIANYSSSTNSGWIFFFAFLFASLPAYTSGQDVVQRYVTTPSEKAAANSLWLNILMTIVGSAIFFALGTALYVFYQNSPQALDPTMDNPQGILPFFIMQNLPIGIAGLIIAGVFAAAQSTISSSLNSVATAFVTDVYGRVIAPESEDSKRLKVARNVVILLGILGIVGACTIKPLGIKSIFDLFNMFIGFVLGPLAAIFALGIFTKRVGGAACLIGALTGMVTIGVVTYMNKAGTIDIWSMLNGLICFAVTFFVSYTLSFIFPANSEKVKGLNIHSK